jgi:hypothetical protein
MAFVNDLLKRFIVYLDLCLTNNHEKIVNYEDLFDTVLVNDVDSSSDTDMYFENKNTYKNYKQYFFKFIARENISYDEYSQIDKQQFIEYAIMSLYNEHKNNKS